MGETLSETYESVTNYTLKITYQHSGKKYEKLVKHESYSNSYYIGQKIFVTFNMDSPETVIDISDVDILSGLKMMRLSLAILPILIVLLLLSYVL